MRSKFSFWERSWIYFVTVAWSAQNFASSRVLLELKYCYEGWVGFCWLVVVNVEVLKGSSGLSILYFSWPVWDQFILCRTRERVCACSVFVCLNWPKLIFGKILKMIHLCHLFLMKIAFLYVSFWWWTKGCNFSIKSTESMSKSCREFLCQNFFFFIQGMYFWYKCNLVLSSSCNKQKIWKHDSLLPLWFHWSISFSPPPSFYSLSLFWGLVVFKWFDGILWQFVLKWFLK